MSLLEGASLVGVVTFVTFVTFVTLVLVLVIFQSLSIPDTYPLLFDFLTFFYEIFLENNKRNLI